MLYPVSELSNHNTSECQREIVQTWGGLKCHTHKKPRTLIINAQEFITNYITKDSFIILNEITLHPSKVPPIAIVSTIIWNVNFTQGQIYGKWAIKRECHSWFAVQSVDKDSLLQFLKIKHFPCWKIHLSYKQLEVMLGLIVFPSIAFSSAVK